MLDADTKRRIDTARDILVGKIPDPKSQVEQITLALIYKFMDDMDALSEELGGRRGFFAGDFERYGWAKLMRSGLGGQEKLNLYGEAIAQMPQNPGLPLLFRDIFSNAFLPYRDPETLMLFLEVIDGFSYGDSENLGDAYEYLLSVLGVQGDAGQFRTPRHVIDFIVAVVNPQKTETILDPACGTAGFLISAWQHIRQASADARGGDTLTPAERHRLAANLLGYDISPDFVRLSRVNMYLHGFAEPHIVEYDTLTSQERWDQYADVIITNPPFMSPRGGIQPHNRFSVQSRRSEVLFVDYIAEHLNPQGRAGVIVPEGVIFQSGNAYKQLRKMLVDNYLAAVISLPGGVFQPYSGVKTSILILDKSLAGRADTVAFFKVERDGFDLGAQRRPIDQDDLPAVQSELQEYLRRLRAGESLADFAPQTGLVVDKAKLAAGGEYNLSGERYRENGRRDAKFPYMLLVDIAAITAGNSAPQGDEYFKDGVFPFVRTADVGAVHRSDNFTGAKDWVNQQAVEEKKLRQFPAGTILFPKSGASTFLNHRVVMGEPAYVSSHLAGIVCNREKALPQFVYQLLCQVDARQLTADQNYPSLRLSEIGNIQIPLPPLSVQEEIVAEVAGYQRVIDGARAVVDNWRPRVDIDPSWPVVALGECSKVESGFGFPLAYQGKTDDEFPFLKVSDMNLPGNEEKIVSWNNAVSGAVLRELKGKAFPTGTVIFPKIGAAIATNKKRILTRPATFDNNVMGIVPDPDKLLPDFLHTYLVGFDISNWASGAQPPSMRKTVVEQHQIPLPPLRVQEELVAGIEEERRRAVGAGELAGLLEERVRGAVGRVWG